MNCMGCISVKALKFVMLAMGSAMEVFHKCIAGGDLKF